MACTSIREYDHLVRVGAGFHHPRARPISASSFDALLRAIERDPDKLGQALRPGSISGRPSIQAQSFAGVIRTPDGTDIEILPKVVYVNESEDRLETGRGLLIKMLSSVPDMELIDPGPAGIQLRSLPLLEFFILQLLRAVSHVVHRGIRHDYTAMVDSEPFVRGRIMFAEQVRRNLARQHLCHNEHDQFLPDCPENRLIRTALDAVMGLTRNARNQQLARELHFCFDEIPTCRDIRTDLSGCRRDPSMSHYRPAIAWAALILERMRPSPTAGRRAIQSVLFAMEDLFECYVYKKLREQCRRAGSLFSVRRQLRARFLTRHRDHSMFLLKPDLSLERHGKAVRILDTKWKVINTIAADAWRTKYGVSQADIYQLFAYGRKYLTDQLDKNVYLIYPKTRVFPKPLEHFEIEHDLRLYVLPFDIERGELLGLDAVPIN